MSSRHSKKNSSLSEQITIYFGFHLKPVKSIQDNNMTSPDSGSTTTREDVKINRRDEILRKIPIPELLDIVDRSNPNSIIDEFIKVITIQNINTIIY